MNRKALSGYNVSLDAALKQGGFYGSTGIWNSLVKIDGKILRGRVEVIVLKKELQQIYMRVINFNKRKYRLPGGSFEKDVPNYIQAQNEVLEEARLKIKNVINTGMHYTKIYNTDKQIVGIENHLKWQGSYTEVYVAEYDSPYTGFVDKEDEDQDMYENGMFYDISEVYPILSEVHKRVIDDIFPVLKKSEINENMILLKESDNNVHYYPYYTPAEMHALGVHNESKNRFSDIDDEAIEWYYEYTDTLHNPQSKEWLQELFMRYKDWAEEPSAENAQALLNIGWNPIVPVTMRNVLFVSKLTEAKINKEARGTTSKVILIDETTSIFSKNDIVKNFDDFDNGKSNILLITGMAGSGKTTLASQLSEEYDADLIQLDYFQCYEDTANDQLGSKDDPGFKIIQQYVKENKLEKEAIRFSSIRLDSFEKYFTPFFKWLIARLKKDKNKKYIVEGVHIMLYTKYKDISKLPLICVQTSTIKSLVRHWIRDDWSLEDVIKHGYDDILLFSSWNNKYNTFRKDLKESTEVIQETKAYKFADGEKLYFLSQTNMNDELLVPRVPKNYMTDNGFEDNVTKRVCFSTSIDGCLRGMSKNIKGMKFYVHMPEDGQRLTIIKPAVASVPDQLITHEHWVMEKVNLRCIGQIEITGDGDNEYEYTYKKYKYNKTNTAEIPGAKEYKAKLYDWKWRWIWKDDTNLTQENASLLEGFLKSDKDIYYNKDKFDSGEINLCFITGHSGSGKSTMARSMQNAKVEHYELDDLNQNYKFTDDNLKEYGDLIYSFFKGPGKKYRYYSYEDMQNCTNPLDDSGDEFDKCVNRDFVKYAMKYANSHKNTKFVIEGIWLYFFFKPEELKDYAVCIKGTSRVLSAFRAAKRDSKDADTKTKRFIYSIKGTLSTLINKYSIEGERLINKYRDYYGKLEKVNESYIEEGLNLLKKLDEEKVSKEILDTIKLIILTSQNKSKASKLGLDLKCEITEVDSGMVFILVLEGPQEKRDTEETRSLLKDLASKCKSELSDIVSKVDIGDGDEGCLFFTIDKGKIRRKRKDLLESYIEESSHKSDFSYSGINTSTEKSEFKRNFREVFKEDPTESSVNYMQMIKYKGDLVGYIGFSRYKEGKKKYLGIGNFMILKRYQRSGMGSKVISDIIDRYKDNYDEIYCYVDKDNTNAIAFYKKIAKVNTDNLTKYGYYVTLYSKSIGESAMLEGYLKSDKDIYYNKDKFDSGEINLCFITGLSGSGKSTMGRGMSSKNVEHYEMDDIICNYAFSDDNLKEYGGLVESFFKGPGKEYRLKRGDEDHNNAVFDSHENYEKEITQLFVKHAISYCKSHKRIKYVCDGIWIFMFIKPEQLKDCAVYIKGTSSIKSGYRALKRDIDEDKRNGMTSLQIFKREFKRVKEDVLYAKENQKELKSFRSYFERQSTNESYIEEGYFKSTDNLEFNLDKWSKSGLHNLLYITGISGSGKTTLAKEMCKKYKAEYIELDKFTLGIVKGLDRWFENVNNGTYEVHPLLKEYFSQLDHLTTNGSWSKPDMGDEHTKFLIWLINKVKGDGTLYIVEGAQFFMKLSNMDPDLIKGEPLIVVGTSAFKSWVRRIKRDTSDDETISRFIYHLKKDVPMLFKYYFSNERDLQKYIKNIQSHINESSVLSITEKAKYSPPYTTEEVKRIYGTNVYRELIKDPAHKYRMNTGIELIHKEPTKEELERIWKNWNLMSNDQKMKSDKKSMELFGKTNQDHYNELINSYTVDESSLLEMKRSELDDSEFGLPELRKYPMPDEDHVLFAIKFFNYVSPENEKELARNIKKRMKKYGISTDRVGKKNRLRKYLTDDADMIPYLLEAKKDTPFYFYHLVPKNSDVSKGIMSPRYMYNNGIDDILTPAMDKYRDRLVDFDKWNIYPDKDPSELTTKEILNGLDSFRGIDGSSQIYLFRFPPYGDLGRNMKEILKHKDIYRIDLNDPQLKRHIKSIDWGYVNSDSRNGRLTSSYYENISPEEYFSKYNDTDKPLFRSLHHISVVMKDGYIPKKFLTKINYPLSIQEFTFDNFENTRPVLVFDLGSVLIDSTMSFEEALTKSSKIPNELVSSICEYINNNYVKNKDKLEYCEEADYYRYMIDHAPDNIKKYIPTALAIDTEILKPFSYTESLLGKLKCEGYKLYYISNWSKWSRDALLRKGTLDFLRHFDGGIFSCDVHICKPNKGIFVEFFAKYTEMAPCDTYFFDDNSDNISAAISVGMNGVLFNKDFHSAQWIADTFIAGNPSY